MYTDLFIDDVDELIEAKSDSTRGSIRLGLGQVLDYARYVPSKRRALLVPVQPSAELIALLHMYDTACIWTSADGDDFQRVDP